MEDGFDPRLQVSDFTEATGIVSENEEVAAKTWEISAVVYQALQCGTYLYLVYALRTLMNNALYTDHINWKRGVLFEIRSPKLPMVF